MQTHFKNLAYVISYLNSDSLRYLNLYEQFRTKPQDSIQLCHYPELLLSFLIGTRCMLITSRKDSKNSNSLVAKLQSAMIACN